MRFRRQKPTQDVPAAAAPPRAPEPVIPRKERPDPALGLAVKKLREGRPPVAAEAYPGEPTPAKPENQSASL
jgi:hypothetical protein